MAERFSELPNESDARGVVLKKDEVKDLKGIKIEPASNLDGTVDTIYKSQTQTELDREEVGKYRGVSTLWERLSESPKFKKGVALVSTAVVTAGIGMFSKKANAETASVSTPTVDMSEPTGAPTPSKEDAEYTATIAALESLGFSTEHYVERQKKIDEYKRRLVEYAGENINLEACANGAYAIEMSGPFGDPSYTHSEKTVLGNYATVDEMFYFYKNGKFEKGSNLRAIYRKDENGKETDEVGLWSAVNPKIKTLSVDDISGVIDEWEDIAPGFLRTMNDNGVWFIFQSQAGNDETQMMKFNDILIYLNYNGRPSDFLRAGLPVEQFGVRCEALGGEFSAENMASLLKARFAFLDCENLLSSVDEKYVGFLNWWSANYLQTEIAYYTNESLGSRTLNDVNSLIDDAKSKNLMAPFGAATWAEIDAVSSVDATAKSN